MCPEQAITEVKELSSRGVSIELTEREGQCYAWAKGIAAKAPPWSKAAFEILIAIPAAYDAADLNGFYVEQPCLVENGEHPRIKGDVIEHMGRKWRLVSWHYPDGKPWLRGRDTLETHLEHCRGFFVGRGAINAP
jgi:Prokaryotic E2 family E